VHFHCIPKPKRKQENRTYPNLLQYYILSVLLTLILPLERQFFSFLLPENNYQTSCGYWKNKKERKKRKK
jgi:hypothetical protein